MQEDPSLDQYVPDTEEHEVRVDGNRVKFSKLLQEQWEKIERKNFSQFEVRVLSTLQQLGDKQADLLLNTGQKQQQQKQEELEQAKKSTQKKKQQQQQQQQVQEQVEEPKKQIQLEICVGEQLYLQYIRPKLVDYKIIPKLAGEEEQIEDPKNAKKKKEKKGGKNVVKKEDLMRIELSKDKVNDQMQKLLLQMGLIKMNDDIKLKEQEFLKTEQASKRIKSLKWLELKFSALMIYADQLIKCHIHSKFRDEYAFELIYFLKNVYINYQTYQGQSYLDDTKQESLAPQAIKDLKKKLGEMFKNFGFSNRLLFTKYPKLVIDTELNQSFQRTDIKPYFSQIELLQNLSKFITKQPACIFLSTMVGTGKTVLSVAIAQFIQRIRDEPLKVASQLPDFQYKNVDKLQFLYCCPLDTVRTQVGSAAYERKLKFAIASMWQDPFAVKKEQNQGFGECPRLVNSWQNKNEAFPTLVIADFKTTLELLKEKDSMSDKEKTVIRWQGKDRKSVAENPAKSGKDYILFIDEPTVDADFADAETTKLLIEIIRRAPAITILSSATLPAPEKLPNFLKLYKKNQIGDSATPTIFDSQFQIGCQVFSHNGHKFLPHYQAKNKQQLAEILDRLNSNPFMKRCYNANAYCELFDRMKECGVEDVDDFETFDVITQEFVQKKSIELLEKLLQNQITEETFIKVCSEKPIKEQEQQQLEQQEQKQEEQQEEEDEDYEYEYVYEDQDQDQDQENTQNDQTDQPKAKKYIYQIQVEDDDKMKFTAPYTKLNMKTLGGKMAHRFQGGCLIAVKDPVAFIRKNFEKLIRKCTTAQDYIKQYLKQFEYLEKEIMKKERDIENEDERSKQIQALQEGMRLTIAFPDFLKINTLEHYKKFVTDDPLMLDHYRARKAFSLEAINYQVDVPDDILLYLFTGIAAYTEKPSNLPVAYYEEVQKLATNGQLALIISDDSMCYGVNYPLNHVIVTDEMACQRSVGALFQLIGRAGRVGVSWTANAYLGNKTFQRLVNYLNGKNAEEDKEKDEAFNMENQAKNMIQHLINLTKLKKQQQEQMKKDVDDI